MLMLGLGLSILGFIGLLGAKKLDNELMLKVSVVLILAGAINLAIHTIRKKEEPVSRGDDLTLGYLHGFQAVTSGLAHLVLALAFLVPAVAWLAGYGDEFMAWLKANAGLAVLAGGLWLFLSSVGVVFGAALSSVGAYSRNKVDAALLGVNSVIEKIISLILCLAGLGLIILGLASIFSSTGPLTLLLELL